jgi:hypothetical protein
MKYDIKIGLKKGVEYFVIFLLPILVDKFIYSYPQLAQLSVGALLVMVVNFLKITLKK